MRHLEYPRLVLINTTSSNKYSYDLYKLEIYSNIFPKLKLLDHFDGRQNKFNSKRILFQEKINNFNQHHLRVASINYGHYFFWQNVVRHHKLSSLNKVTLIINICSFRLPQLEMPIILASMRENLCSYLD